MGGLTAEEHSAIQDLSERVETGDYYVILGVAPTCSSAELKKAYYDLSRRFHPDRFYRRDIDEFRDTLEEVFTGINISFEVLSDDVRRRRFDLENAKKVDGGENLSERRNRSSSRPARAKATRSEEPLEAAQAPPQRAAAVADKPSRGPDPTTSPVETSEVPVSPHEASKPIPENETARSAPSDEDSQESSSERRMSTYARHRARMRKSRERSKSSSGSERRARRTSSSETSSPESTKRSSSKVTEAVRGRINARLEKAKACYHDGKSAIEEENWVKAASSFYMAHQYSPKNAEYKALWEDAQVKSNQTRAAQFIALAENAESFRNVREAMENYKKAAECDPSEGMAHYRFGQLLHEFADDARTAMQQFRLAVQKEPDNVRYRMALAQLYLSQNMSKNAVREYQKVVEIEPKHKEAKAALRKLRF